MIAIHNWQTNDIVLVWWLTQEDCFLPSSPNGWNYTKLPDYIWKEYESRLGRPGRQRLWVPDEIALHRLPVSPDDIKFSAIPEHSGGIVFWKRDFEIVKMFGGIITDAYLNILSQY